MARVEDIEIQGKLVADKALAGLTWMRVGGPAEYLFQPADTDDLAHFLRALDADVPVFAMGVGSNLIVRDGGIRGVVVKLARAFAGIEFDGDLAHLGAAALDANVARKAAEAGLDLSFLRTIPGAIGGAVVMNAGCYGAYISDVFVEAEAVTRAGEVIRLGADDLNFRYRQTDLPEGTILTRVTLRAPKGEPEAIKAKMAEQLAKRDATQPTKDRTAGSTFRNPAGHSSTGAADESHELKAWKLIDDAGLRGATLGGAQMNPKHPNFLTNTGAATAAELEALGEKVRKKVYEESGLTLEWEIMRVGEPGA
ncbi:MAG: UDP-N-acetylenolpyruvoylglucosamine reductase [Rhodobacterales bacterium]|nr:MAG: UDP-N-acetylenolpyruvoylglucosamine reductase [Rhodobacterales bacterium]PIE09168.1 MAG: UDP-N-acetylenolpyruvoylglucosamine reductase [Rhodobacterales bacterium]